MKIMRTKASLQLAQMIVDALKLHEDSYNQKAADRATEKAGRMGTPGFVDYDKFYKVSLDSACKKIAGPAGLYWPVYLLISDAANDAATWAEEQVGEMGTYFIVRRNAGVSDKELLTYPLFLSTRDTWLTDTMQAMTFSTPYAALPTLKDKALRANYQDYALVRMVDKKLKLVKGYDTSKKSWKMEEWA